MPTPAPPDPPDRPPPREDRAAGSSTTHFRRTSPGLSDLIPLVPTPAGSTPDDALTVITAGRPSPPADPTLGLTAGGRLGHFELIEAVGAGGMAAVLKARDTELGRVVALKILPPHMARDPENVARFKQEGRAAAKFDHDHVARVFFCGEDQGLHFIAFEFVEGETLKALIDRRGPLPPAEAVRYMLGAAAGLAHAADRGVVHRDVKPSNIIVTPDGRAKVVDLGLARSLHQPADGGVTQSGVTLGTFDYISPEQALDPRRADARSDVYSLGCTFYHAVTGRSPVPDGTAARKLHHHRHEPVLDPRVLNPAVPDELAAVLAKMMAKDPARRYQTPADLIAALTALARLLSVGTDTFPALDSAVAAADPSAVRLLPAPPRVSAGLILGAAAVLVAGVVIALTSGRRSPTPPPAWDDPHTAATKPTALGDTPPPAGNPPPTITPAPDAPSQVARTADELVRLLKNPAVAEITLVSGRPYDLTAVADAAVVGGPKKAVVTPPGPPAVVRVAAMPFDPTAPPTRPGALTVTGTEVVRFKNLKFEVADGRPAEDMTDDRPAAVAVLNAGSLTVAECRFVAAPGLESAAVAGLAVARTGADGVTDFTAQNCYFGLGRGAAVELTGRVRAAVSESAFVPHAAAVVVASDPADATRAELTVRHCSFLLDTGAVVEAAEGARWDVAAGYCVFAAGPPAADAMMMDPPARRPALVRSPADAPDAARFRALGSQPNLYYGVAPPAAGADPLAVEPAVAPWATDPTVAAGGSEPRTAFRLRPARAFRAAGDEVVLGVRFLTADDPARAEKLYDPWPPAFQGGEAAERGVKVWWPNPDAAQVDSLPRNVFVQFEEAVAAAKPGDVIRVRHNGLLRVPPTLLAKPKLRLTVRPDDGYAPVLTLGDSEQLEPSLFRLVDGESLTLEGLTIRLRGRAGKTGPGKAAAVVTVVGGRLVTLQDCVVTLDPQDDEDLSAVALADPGGGEMRTGDDKPPAVRFKRCVVRGKGRAVWVPAARPFDLEVSDTVTALAGPVVDVNPPAKAPPAGAGSHVRLTRVTAALAGPLLDLDLGPTPGAGKPAWWTPVELEADRCLFAAVGRGNPVVRVTNGDPAAPLQAFTVAPRGPNWYANFPPAAAFLDVTPADAVQTARSFDADGWFGLTNESAAPSLGRVTFAAGPFAFKNLTTLTAAGLTVATVTVPGGKVGDVGADAAKLPKAAEAADRP